MIETYWLMIVDFSFRVYLCHMDLDTHHLLLKRNDVDDLLGGVGETVLCLAAEIVDWISWVLLWR